MSTKPININDWLDQLGQPQADRDYKPGHERLLALLAAFPPLNQPRLRIRIAGTNGKGSTAFMLSSALQAAGLKVGLYTSPHIHTFNERMRINGSPISDEALQQLMQQIMPIALKVGTSYFETATALTLQHFSQQHVDVEILEAGVGARLDATTAVAAEMALITPIGLDHQHWLGDSLESISGEKAYVLHGCKWACTAGQQPEVLKILQHHHAKLQVADAQHIFNCSTPGLHQQQNAALADAAMQMLIKDGIVTTHAKSYRIAIEQTIVPGRLQHIQHGQANIWLDAAHNQHAVEALLPSLSALADPFDAMVIFTREDRNLNAALPLLKSYTQQIITPGLASEPCYSSIESTLDTLLITNPQAKILVLGSFITVAAALKHLRVAST